MRRDNHYLEDIRIAATHIGEYIAGLRLQDFRNDNKTRAATERQLIIMGEAANRVSAEFKAQHANIPWDRLIQLRHFYVHGYHRLEVADVWGAASRFAPRILRLISPLIADEEDEE